MRNSLIVQLAGLLISIPAWAQAPTYKLHETTGWKAKLPANWEARPPRHYGPELHVGRWVFISPNHNLKFRVLIEHDKGEDFKKILDAGFEQMHKLVTDPKIAKQEQLKADGKDVFYIVLSGLLPVKDFLKEHLIFRMLIRVPENKLFVTLTLAATGEKMDTFLPIVETLMESFELVKPKPAPAALPPPAPAPLGKKK
jgi:hypothetical protein